VGCCRLLRRGGRRGGACSRRVALSWSSSQAGACCASADRGRWVSVLDVCGGAVSAQESSVRAERRRARNPPRYFAIRTRSAYSALSWPISSCVNRGQRRKSGARSSSRSDPWWTRSSASIAARSSGSSFTPETFPGGAPRKRLCRTFLRRRVSSAHALGISFSLQ